MSPLASDLIARAQACHILEVARRYGALERVTAIEFAGPCPVCGGTDRFMSHGQKVYDVAKGDTSIEELTRHIVLA